MSRAVRVIKKDDRNSFEELEKNGVGIRSLSLAATVLVD